MNPHQKLREHVEKNLDSIFRSAFYQAGFLLALFLVPAIIYFEKGGFSSIFLGFGLWIFSQMALTDTKVFWAVLTLNKHNFKKWLLDYFNSLTPAQAEIIAKKIPFEQ